MHADEPAVRRRDRRKTGAVCRGTAAAAVVAVAIAAVVAATADADAVFSRADGLPCVPGENGPARRTATRCWRKRGRPLVEGGRGGGGG